MFITAFCVLFFIKLSSSSSFNFIYKIINKNYKIALARKTVKLKARMPDCIISGKQINSSAHCKIAFSVKLWA